MSFVAQPQTLFSIGPNRQFGSPANIFTGYVTISENATDAIEITQQPVQQGATIADHAFKKPYSLTIQIKFEYNLFLSLASIYASLLALQNSFVPFNCVTPKRTYYNMLLQTLGQTTDKKTENCLAITATFQQVILAPISTVQLNPTQLANAAANAGTQDAGTKNSGLYNGAQAVKALF